MDNAQFFWPILAKNFAELSNLISQFQWKLSGEDFLGNLQIVIFQYRAEKFRLPVRKKVSGAFKLLSTYPLELFEEKTFEKFLHLLWTFFQIISGNWLRKVWPACQNCILRIYKIILKKTVLENKWNFSPFSNIEQEVLGLLSIFFGEFVETTFYVSIGTLYRKKRFIKTNIFPIILENKRNFFETLFQRVCQKRKLQIQKSFFGTFF